MADITITATSVVAGTGAKTKNGTAGETITAGQTLYLKASDGRLWKADANAASDALKVAAVVGIALNGGVAGQPIEYQESGLITIGGTTVVGIIYVQSATAGGIAPAADLVTASYVSIIGVGATTGSIKMARNNSGYLYT